MKRLLSAFLLGAVVVVTACSGDGDAPTFLVRDSAGIQIVDSYRPVWGEGGGWQVGPEPILRFGVVDGDPALQFDGVVGLARLADGTVVVGDGGSQELRFFDSAGNLINTAGGSGEGPGEFAGLSVLGSVDGESVWAYDFSLRRITWLNGTGGVEGMVSLGPVPPVLNAVGPLPDGTFLLKQLWGATQVAEATETGFSRDPVAFVRFGTEGALVDTLGLFPGRELFLTDENGRGVMSTPPFARNSVGTVWNDGVVVGTQDSFELVNHTPEGEVTRVVRIPAWDLALGPAELEEYIQVRLREVPSERRPSLRQELESMPIPSTRPAYGGVLADEAGNLWVSEWTIYPEVPMRWTVLDGSGRWLGEVVLAGRFRPFAIGEDWILGVEWDELEVEYVAVYPLLKGAVYE
ncbi:MAG: hypothetical protein ABIF09_02200 [Gemmatimonadota bacterium]